MVGRQKVKGFKAVHIQFQGLFVAGGGQWSVVHGIIDLTSQEANGAVDLKYIGDRREEREKAHNSLVHVHITPNFKLAIATAIVVDNTAI